jgi:hypothetical protein
VSHGRILYLRCDFPGPFYVHGIDVGGCTRWTLDDGVEAEELYELRKAARAKGWVRTPLGDFCPDHAKQGKGKR